MTRRRRAGLVSLACTTSALAIAQVRYWFSVAPCVRDELRRWQVRAEAIKDPVLRTYAATKLHDERTNVQGIATLCTLAPRRHRRAAVEAAVALQVMYDYLDAVTERPVHEQARAGRQLFRAFAVALAPGEIPVDYYRYYPHSDDGGYLDSLVGMCQRCIVDLPALPAVLPTARETASRFSEAQVRSHAVPTSGAAQLERWALGPGNTLGLTWWEWAGGAAASVLAVHALLAAAADPRTGPAQATRIDDAYLLQSVLATLLDSLIDDARDEADGAHRYVAYYPTAEQAACRVAVVARDAVAAVGGLPHSAHHAMTVAGIAAFYLSTPDAQKYPTRIVTARVTDELKPIIVPILATFRLWRRIKTS